MPSWYKTPHRIKTEIKAALGLSWEQRIPVSEPVAPLELGKLVEEVALGNRSPKAGPKMVFMHLHFSGPVFSGCVDLR